MQSKFKGMTIHVVGAQRSNFPWGTENRIIAGFEALGCRVISTDFRQQRKNLSELLCQKADLMLVCKGEGINPSLIRNSPVVTALWYAEQIGSLGKTNELARLRRSELIQNIAAFDYVFSHDAGNLELMRQMGGKNVSWLSCASIDPAINAKLSCEKKKEVVFVGSKTPYRNTILNGLHARGIEVFSPGIWDPVELNTLFNESKVVLNLHLSELPNTETRIAEVVGAGSFLISEKFSSPDLLVPDEHFVEWDGRSIDGLCDLIKHYLQHDQEREDIAAQGYYYMMARHTWTHRLTQLLEQVDFTTERRIWPSFSLGILRNSQGFPTLRIDEFYANVKRPLSRIYGHRGDLEKYKSNTKESTVSGLERSDGVELDLSISSDAQFYFCHEGDWTTQRLARNFALNDLHKFVPKGESLLTLEEALEIVERAQKPLLIHLEIGGGGEKWAPDFTLEEIQTLVMTIEKRGTRKELIQFHSVDTGKVAYLRERGFISFSRNCPASQFAMLRTDDLINAVQKNPQLDLSNTVAYTINDGAEFEKFYAHKVGIILTDKISLKDHLWKKRHAAENGNDMLGAKKQTTAKKGAKAGGNGKHQGRMRIFAAYANVNWEENNLRPALEELGDVVTFNWPFQNQYAPDWHSVGKAAHNKKLIECFYEEHQKQPFDLFFGYVSGRVVFPDLIKAIGEMGVPTLCLSLDDKAKFEGPREASGHAGMVDIAREFSLCWTSTIDSIPKYRAAGAKAIFMPPAANPKMYRHMNLQQDIDVSFIGQKYGQRPVIIEKLREMGHVVETFGRGWNNGEISFEEMIRVINRSKINLGFAGVGAADDVFCLKARDFEIPMAGGFYLTQFHRELDGPFVPGVDIVCYDDTADLSNKIKHFLKNDAERETIRMSGFKKATSQHTWRQRFVRALTLMGLRSKINPGVQQGALSTESSREKAAPVIRTESPRKEARSTADDQSYYQRQGGGVQNKKSVIQAFILKESAIQDVLDVGCNTGSISAPLVQKGVAVTGIDSSKELQPLAGMQFLNKDIMEMNAVLMNDCTLFLSLYHHIVARSGRREADRLFYQLLLRSNWLVFDSGTIEEKGPEREHWLFEMRMHFKNQDEMLQHFGLPFQKIGSWETGNAFRDIVVFQRSDFDSAVEVVAKFKRKKSYANLSGNEEEAAKDTDFFEDTVFYKLKIGGTFFFAKKHLVDGWESNELKNLIEVYDQFPPEELLVFYGVSEKFGLIYEWVDDLLKIRNVRDEEVHGILLKDADLVEVNGQVKYIDFWSLPNDEESIVLEEIAIAGQEEPGIVPALIEAGETLFGEGDISGAKQKFDDALKLDSQNVEVLNNLGVVESANGNMHGAVTFFQRALEIDGGYEPAALNFQDCQTILNEEAPTI